MASQSTEACPQIGQWGCSLTRRHEVFPEAGSFSLIEGIHQFSLAHPRRHDVTHQPQGRSQDAATRVPELS
jgi:hypothetical protein